MYPTSHANSPHVLPTHILVYISIRFLTYQINILMQPITVGKHDYPVQKPNVLMR